MRITIDFSGKIGDQPFLVHQEVPAAEFTKWAGRVGQVVQVTLYPDYPPHWGSVVYEFDAVVESVTADLNP